MKLHSYLPKPGASLYLAPLLNGILLLLIFFLLGSTFVIQSGVSVKLPESPSRLSGFDRAHVVTVSNNSDNPFYFDAKPVTLDALRKLLAEKKRESHRLIVHADQMVPFGRVMEISNAALALGYEIAYATQPPRNF
jgi:biopolymer transport protein ExbD